MAAHALTITKHFIRALESDRSNLHDYVMYGIGAMGFCTYTGNADDDVWRKLYDWADKTGSKEELRPLLDLSLQRHAWMEKYKCYEDIYANIYEKKKQPKNNEVTE
jgi:hypothetical protein